MQNVLPKSRRVSNLPKPEQQNILVENWSMGTSNGNDFCLFTFHYFFAENEINLISQKFSALKETNSGKSLVKVSLKGESK